MKKTMKNIAKRINESIDQMADSLNTIGRYGKQPMFASRFYQPYVMG